MKFMVSCTNKYLLAYHSYVHIFQRNYKSLHYIIICLIHFCCLKKFQRSRLFLMLCCFYIRQRAEIKLLHSQCKSVNNVTSLSFKFNVCVLANDKFKDLRLHVK